MTATRIDKLLNSGDSATLQELVQTAQNMQELTLALRRALPEDTAAELLAANLRANGELAIVASSSAWAAKLRFEENILLKAARDAGHAPVGLRVSVARGNA